MHPPHKAKKRILIAPGVGLDWILYGLIFVCVRPEESEKPVWLLGTRGHSASNVSSSSIFWPTLL